MSQEREAIKKTLIAAPTLVPVIILALAAFFGAFEVLTMLFDSLGFRPGNSGMLALLVIWCIVVGGSALRWKYEKTLAEIRQRDEKIMKGLRE